MNQPFNLKEYADKINSLHFNELISNINDHCLKIAINEDSIFEWHYHTTTDELFIILEGVLTIEFKDENSITLKPLDCYHIPSGKIHRTIAKGRTVNLCFEATKDDTIFVT